MQNLMVGELNANQTQINQLQTEISTGYQFQLPSQNPQAAMQVEGIQSLLERKTQMQTNISTTQSSLSQTDSTLSSVSNLLTSVQSAALSVVGATATPSQRQAVVEQIDSTVQQLVSLGNTQFNGQQLFGGTDTTTPPFSIDAAGNVVYSGNSTPTETYVDINQLFATQRHRRPGLWSNIAADRRIGADAGPFGKHAVGGPQLRPRRRGGEHRDFRRHEHEHRQPQRGPNPGRRRHVDRAESAGRTHRQRYRDRHRPDLATGAERGRR